MEYEHIYPKEGTAVFALSLKVDRANFKVPSQLSFIGICGCRSWPLESPSISD